LFSDAFGEKESDQAHGNKKGGEGNLPAQRERFPPLASSG
jgi:hypothetical protein